MSNVMETDRVAICVLSRGYFFKWKYKALIKRNNAIYNNIKSNKEIDFIVFHEGNISKSAISYINKMSLIKDIKYISVKPLFEKKHNTKSNSICKETPTSRAFPQGYKCMCQFWFSEFLKHTSEYKYVVRIDEDCFITYFPIDNLISDMESGNSKYITPRIYGLDSPDVTVGLDKLCDDFVIDQKLEKQAKFDRNPYTNVFILDGEYFRKNKLYAEFSDKVNQTECIYINRWGDLPLWGCILSLIGDDIMAVSESIKYMHGSHNELIN